MDRFGKIGLIAAAGIACVTLTYVTMANAREMAPAPAPSPAPAAAPAVLRAGGPKIGIFDSRAVALAYWRSPDGVKQTQGLHREYEKAKEAKDEARMKELEAKGPGLQVRLHQQVFSTGCVTDVIDKIRASLPKVAEEAGVPVLVSKWQIAYQDPSVESVDVTDQLVELFHPTREIRKMVAQLHDIQPVPIEELSMDPND